MSALDRLIVNGQRATYKLATRPCLPCECVQKKFVGKSSIVPGQGIRGPGSWKISRIMSADVGQLMCFSNRQRGVRESAD